MSAGLKQAEALADARLLQRLQRLWKKPVPELRVFPKHVSVREVQEELGEEQMEGLFKFAFVRNPFDLVYSYYQLILQHPNHNPWQKEIRALAGFPQFLDWAARHPVALPRQSPLLFSEKGELLLGFLGRFERLQEDWASILNRLQLPSVSLPVRMKTTHEHWLKVYTPSMFSIVAEILQEDFERLNYATQFSAYSR